MKTIKKIADELGVSKQAVHQKRKKEPLATDLQPFTKTVDGVIYISIDGENLIKKAFTKTSLKTMIDDVYDNKFTHIHEKVSSENSAVFEMLKKQLEIKDKQIAEQQQSIKDLTVALENTTSSLKAAQILHVGTMHQHFESLPPSAEESAKQQTDPINLVAKKESFFSRFFNSKK